MLTYSSLCREMYLNIFYPCLDNYKCQTLTIDAVFSSLHSYSNGNKVFKSFMLLENIISICKFEFSPNKLFLYTLEIFISQIWAKISTFAICEFELKFDGFLRIKVLLSQKLYMLTLLNVLMPNRKSSI